MQLDENVAEVPSVLRNPRTQAAGAGILGETNPKGRPIIPQPQPIMASGSSGKRRERLAGAPVPTNSYTVVAIVSTLIATHQPLFPWAPSGFAREGIQITALVDADTPEEAVEALSKVFTVCYVQTIYEGVVASDTLQWQGFIPQSRPKTGLRSWLANLLS